MYKVEEFHVHELAVYGGLEAYLNAKAADGLKLVSVIGSSAMMLIFVKDDGSKDEAPAKHGAKHSKT